MIKHISIRNFAIIENVDLDLGDGLNIITGETGAGKSIVIEAVSLALGSRADTAFVRSGCDKATIQMIAYYDGEEYIITRDISAGGRNICRINDEIVTLGTLSNLCSKLADIHGQYDHQSLLYPDNHIRLVDLYRRDEISGAKSDVALLFYEYEALLKKMATLKKDQAEGQRQKDFMEYELHEITEAHLIPGEDFRLAEEISLLQNSEKIFQNLAGAYQLATDGDFPVLAAMKQVADMVEYTSEYSEELAELAERIKGVYYEYEDACSSIRECRDKTVFDPEALDNAIQREEMINRLKNKHGRDIPQLIMYADELKLRLDSIENADEEMCRIESEIKKIVIALKDASNKLSCARKESAKALEKLITEQLTQLNFTDAEFRIDFKDIEAFSPEGTDIVEFLITTNRGEPLKSLSKIASGGEMSRIMLAFKKIIGDYDEIPTMIFDEIDSGISGIAASVVGRKLREIAEKHQIICITHLPQIAAYGTSNYRISKHSDDSMTYTTVDALNEKERIAEIARLLGGENITDTTLASARELIYASK
ncbi:MAG: DNA repair protein RecN [Eubacteriales bacterium]|nr:DNA repair protein RecN [Eubacteriales bacterium]